MRPTLRTSWYCSGETPPSEASATALVDRRDFDNFPALLLS
jgi:hypothetical protein